MAQDFPIVALNEASGRRAKVERNKEEQCMTWRPPRAPRLPELTAFEMSGSEFQGQGYTLFTQFYFQPRLQAGKQLRWWKVCPQTLET